MGKPRRLVLFSVTAVLLAVLASGCVGYKPGTFTVGQVGGIGSLRLHTVLCSGVGSTSGSQGCAPSDRSGESQSALGFLVPRGSVAPPTLTATPGPGAAPISFALDANFATVLRETAEASESGMPPGTEAVGYLSSPYSEQSGDELEWTVDGDFGLPAVADGGPFAGNFEMVGFIGWRQVDAMQPASRPFDCIDVEPSGEIRSGCSLMDETPYGVQQLKLAAPGPVAAFLGGKAKLSFGLAFATTQVTPPTFALAAATTLPGAQVALSNPSFEAGPRDPSTNRAPLATRNVKVTVPANAKPGTYDVSLTATASSGGVVTQVAQLRVSKAKLGFKVKLDKAKGTAVVRVKVPAAGKLTVGGKAVKPVTRKPSKAKWVNLTLRPKGAAKAKLEQTGAAKVTAKFKFKPAGAPPVTKTKTVTLRLS